MTFDGHDAPPPGVRVLDHTADVGLDVSAPDWPGLLLRAAAGLRWLLEGRRPHGRTPHTHETRLEVEAPDAALLLAAWLRELLYQHQVHGRAVAHAAFDEVSETRLVARITCAPAPTHPLREIKGVTYHALAAGPADGGWRARVIFDV